MLFQFESCLFVVLLFSSISLGQALLFHCQTTIIFPLNLCAKTSVENDNVTLSFDECLEMFTARSFFH